MSRKRNHLPLTTKLASCLAELQYLRGDPIPFKQLQDMTAGQLCSLYQWDHSIYAAWNGGEHYTNITPRLTQAHREKTHKIDIPTIAKVKRIAKARRLEISRSRMAKKRATGQVMRVDVTGARDDGHNTPRPKPKRPMPGSKGSPFRKAMDGRVTRR